MIRLFRNCLALVAFLGAAFPAFADPAPVERIRGSAEYRTAFECLAGHRLDEALEAAGKLDVNQSAARAEREAIAAWADFAECRFDSAADKAEAALAADPQQALALMLKARLLASENALARAEATARAAVAADPSNPVVLWWSADVLEASGADVATRVRWIERVIELGGVPGVRDSVQKARSKLDLARALGKRTTRVVATEGRGELPFTRSAGTDSLCRVELPLPGGQVQPMTLDTGATGIALPEAAARALGGDRLGDAKAFGLAGEFTVEQRLVDSLTAGGMTFQPVVVSTVPTPVGVLGMSLFREQVLVVDFARRKIIVFTDRDAFGKEWGKSLEGVEPLRFRTFRNGVFLPVRLKAGGDSETGGAMFLDTGSSMTVLNEPFALGWSRDGDVPVHQGEPMPVMGANGVEMVRFKYVEKVSVLAGAMRIDTPAMPVADFGPIREVVGLDFSGLVGMDQLGKHRFLVFDFPKRELYLGPRP